MKPHIIKFLAVFLNWDNKMAACKIFQKCLTDVFIIYLK